MMMMNLDIIISGDEKEYLKTLKLEAQKRQDTMQQIIKNRSFQSIPLQMHDFMRGEQQ
jgi:hypothetical protein